MEEMLAAERVGKMVLSQDVRAGSVAMLGGTKRAPSSALFYRGRERGLAVRWKCVVGRYA